MKSYPSIPSVVKNEVYIYAFNKIDGSNVRAEWSKKKGFYKFGSRKRLIGDDQGLLAKAESLIKKDEDIISEICNKNRWEKAIFFYEFSGENSEFGIHSDSDNHQVYLIDANPFKKGILIPKDFLKIFQDKVQIAECLYQGICDSDFVKSVRDGTLEGMSKEGVVCKMKGKGNTIDMFKIKSNYWYNRLRDFCGDDENKFKTLK